MSTLEGKKILLGITGGIAAYKIPSLVRIFTKAGATVRVVMTPAAKDFVTPLTLSTLSKNEVYSSFTNSEGEQWNSHVELGLWADLFLIAPLTASTLSKMVAGNSDNLLIATYLSARCPVFFAPAMDLDMYHHPATQKNFQILTDYGNSIIPVESGELASGLTGKGRMAEPETIFKMVAHHFQESLPLQGKKIIVTAGPTYEAIDPVRFIGNHSSGKMGYEVAKCAQQLGAEVILISGPTYLENPHEGIKRISVFNTQEMYEAVLSYFDSADVVIAAAAVSDYRPETIADQKIKKKEDSLTIPLTKTQDILQALGKQKKHQKLIGFALETTNELAHAKSKLERKNLDFVVLNSLQDEGAGFKTDTNKVSFIFSDREKHFELKSKAAVATDILNEIMSLFDE